MGDNTFNQGFGANSRGDPMMSSKRYDSISPRRMSKDRSLA